MEGRKFGKFLRLFVLLALTVALVLAVGIMAFSQGAQADDKECYLAGDMNADGELTSADAVYLYNHVTKGDAEYPVRQDADINGDGLVNEKDASALLYAFYGWKDANPQIGLMVHDYYEPAWTWTEDGATVTAQVTIKCACSEPETLPVEDITSDVTLDIEATCAATGRKVYNARIEVNGQILTSTYTQILPALAHQPGEMVTTDEAQHYQLCIVCDAKVNVADHAWEAYGDVVKGDCQTQSTQKYVCDCGAEKTEQLGLGVHTYVYEMDVPVDENCTYAKQYRCSVCENATYLADEYTNHNYRTVITQLASCQSEGEKASKCDACGHVRSTEVIAANNHNWIEGAVVAGVRTDTCDICFETKTTAVADGAVSKDVLNNSDEVTVGDATMSMDQDVKDNLAADRDVVLSAGTVDKNDLGLSEDQLDQIGDNQVYDFNMVYEDNGEKVDFDGKITISLPYELTGDEDIDAIDVWYIDEEGNAISCEATYNNGYITFEVTHFSYYTVTRLTPRERCERYGHFWTDTSKTATCTTDGYIGQVCQRCNLERNDAEFTPSVIPATGHSYGEEPLETSAAGCTTFGYLSYKCEICAFVSNQAIKPLGHDVQTTTTAATCAAPGKIEHSCSRCDYSRQEVLAQLTHEYEHDEAQDVAVTCTEGGYEIYVCKHCGEQIKKNEKPAKGHNYHKDNAEWTWDPATDEDPYVVVSCSNDGCEATKELTPKVVVTEAGCETESSAVATVYYNGTKFEKSYAKGPALGHDMDTDSWYYNDAQHYRRCNRCGMQENAADHILEQIETEVEAGCTTDGLLVYYCSVCDYTYEEVLPATGEHSMNAGVVTREPTCTLDGVKLYTCELCGYTEKETLPATGHSFVDDVCTACGKIDGCAHINVFKAYYELADYGMCGGWLDIYGCDCGQGEWTYYSIGDCDWVYVEEHDYLGDCWICTECGATRIEAWVYEETSSCTAKETFTCTLLDADGKEIVTFRKIWNHEYHEYQLVSVVMSGETCEDGVTKTYTCATCGDSHTSTYDYHHEDRYYYSLSSYGMCGGWIESYVCVCGIQQGADWYFHCDFVTVEEAEGKRTLYCEDCGTYMYVTYTEEKYNECVTFYGFDAELSNETMGNETLSFGTTMGEHNHQWAYELTLLEGATSCEDGFTVKEYCQRCGEDWGVWEEYGHCTYVVERAIISEGQLCGNVQKLIYSCACGQESFVEYRVEGCSYYYNGYDETLGCDTYLCERCGAIRYTTQVSVPVEGIGCQTEWITTYHYLRDGEEILTYERSHINYSHVCEAIFEKLGDTCDDGYIVYNHCIYCDYSYERGTHYGCQMFVVEVETKLSSEDFCSTVFQYNYSCPCGANVRHEELWENHCSFEWIYNEALGRWVDTCSKCGLTYYSEGFNEVIDPEKPCYTMNGYRYTYLDKDGNELCVVINDWRNESHTFLHTFEKLGTTCDDGYEVTRYCAYCDYSDEYGTYYGCQNWLISVDVKLDSEAYCSKVYQYNYDCPCGACAQSDRYWQNYCAFESVYDEAMDRWVNTCTECGLTFFSEWFREAIDPETPCYTMEGHRYTYLDQNGNVLCVVTDDWKSESHTWLHAFEMQGETCEDGYEVTRYCAYCDYSDEYGTYYGCQNWLISVDVKLDSEAYCTKVYQRTYSCPCGANVRHEEPWENHCSFEGIYNEALGRWVDTCSKCGLTYYGEGFNEVIDPALPCFTMNGTRYYYCDANGNVLCVTVNDHRNENHTYLHTFHMYGATCDDGYVVTRTCCYCGDSYEYGTYYGCNNWLISVDVKLDSEAYCSKVYQYNYDCPCGACAQSDRHVNNNCSFNWVYHDALQRWVYTCTTCGLTYTEESFSEVIDPAVPCYGMNGTRYTYYDMDGNALCVVTDDWKNESHTYLYTFHMYGTTCADGYDAFGTCKYCGKTTTSEKRSGCQNWLISVETKVDSADYCSKIEQYNYSCPCGACAQSDRHVSNNCSFNWVYHDALQRWVYTCTTCGLTYTEESFSEAIDPAVPCYRMNGTRYTYYDVDGNELCVVTDNWRNESHTYLYTFHMYGTTCADGYDAFGTCKYCGKTTTSEKRSGCQNWLISVETKVDSADYCSKIEQYNYSCPCGDYFCSDRVWTNNCSFEGKYNAILDRHVYTCTECGLAYTEEYFSEVIDPAKPCYKMNGWRYTYYDADYNQLCVVTNNWRNEEHVYLYTYQMQGTTCADGYSITGTCKLCDRSYTDGIYTGCETRRIERYDLTEYGMCGGYVDYYECGCGAYSNINYSMPCNYSWTGEYNDQGVQGRYCKDCNTTFYWGNQGGVNREECRTVNTYYLTVIRDGETVTDMVLEASSVYHTMLMVGYEGNCGTYVKVCYECKYCGKEETNNYHSEGHGTHLTGFVDLEAGGACGGWISFYQCPCGEYTDYSYNQSGCSFSYEEEQELLPDGNTLYKRTRTCSTCGLVLYEEWTVIRDASTCKTTRVRTIWARMGEVELGTFTEREVNTAHRYGDTTYALLDPTKSCEAGLIGKQICLDCGYENTWRTGGHAQYKQNSIDLKQYGSVCGCELEYWACPCGKYQSYRLSEEACDLDRNWTSMWIDNVISGEGQYTTDGWNWFYSDAYTYTCAVTDPQCTLKVRMAEYWLQEGCEAVRYQVWQLGYSETYDSATGQWTYSWDEEIIIATGDRSTWHSYEYTYGSETLDDGTTVYTNSYICSTCGSSYVEKHQYKNGTHVGTECTAINLLNNGKTKQRTEIWFDGFEHNGSFYRTYEKNAYVYADGTEYWNEYTYEYFVDGQCKKVTTWRDSNGESGSYESEHTGRYGKWIWEKYPTCSQSGVELYEEYCVFCHELQYTTIYDRTPYGHMWYMDPDTGIYKCGRCGLENSNGADGTIIMEDLTAAYGNNTNYVVGYYNQGNGKFTVYASVILVDATDENNELVLTGIEFTYLTVAGDGICALTADQAAIQAAATAAMEAVGYTGTYAIRIAFVPVDGDGMLDYAITFDSQTAGGNA